MLERISQREGGRERERKKEKQTDRHGGSSSDGARVL